MKTDFPEDLSDAREFQKRIAEKAVIKDSLKKISKVGALDVAYKGKQGYVAGIIFDVEKKEVIEKRTLKDDTTFPYIPTFLFLREVPFFLKILPKFSNMPDLFLIDGHGIAHPYFAGSATIFGVLANQAAIGVAKKPLRYFSYSPSENKKTKYIKVKERDVGIQYKSNEKWNPIYISPGNKISISTSFRVVKQIMSSKYKIPIPLHLAHLAAAESKSLL
ncbi:MAG: endonuclease V [Candidatus Heimdallarchaeaceae archaeon]|jgi:deoxyribonuclease V